MAGTWTSFSTGTTGPQNPGTMLLLTDGSVLVHDEPNSATATGSNRWFRLIPDHNGNYDTGTWKAVANAVNSPLYFACAVLRDGRVLISGGEYNGTGVAVELAATEIYDPISDTWTSVGAPAGWAQIGDAPSALLPDGRLLIGEIGGKRTALYNPATGWSAGPNKEDPRGTEETWVLLADQTVLAIECDGRPKTEKYVAAANTWVTAGSTPVTLVDAASDEVGSALLLPDGRVFAIGATDHTALYTAPALASDPGTWAAGPNFPVLAAGNITGAKDAPACLLPNGRVLCIVAPYDNSKASNTAAFWGTPLAAFEFDPSDDSLTQIAAPPNGSGSPYGSRLMLLPNGKVLHTDGSTTIGQYAPDGAPDPVWRPSITSVPGAVLPGSTHTLKGRQINGLSQAVIYGDEGAMATNYPIVRLTHVSTGRVTYCRTHDHSTMGVQTGTAIHSTQFKVPANAPKGVSKLVVIANGIPSEEVSIRIGAMKIGKELKAELKEMKELNIEKPPKLEQENQKLVFEDWRKRFEGFDPGPNGPSDGPGWLDVVRQLAEHGDRLQSEVERLRTFIEKDERPDVGVTRHRVTFDVALLAESGPRDRLIEGVHPGRLPRRLSRPKRA